MKTGDVRRRALLGGAVALVMAVSGCAGSGAVSRGGKGANGERRPSGPDAASPRPLPSASPTPAAVGFDKTAQSTDDPVSSWVVVNKSRPLNPIAYEPPDLVYPDVTFVNRQPLRAEAATALVALFQAGKAEAGLDFSVQSAYRSYDSQVRVYGYEAARSGVASADAGTARPGHSEHQIGFAVDISAVPAQCSLSACFAQTPQGEWLAANAWRFGFLLRYPADKVAVTGFMFEPWHYRYIGIPLATHLHATGVTTLEEFFGLPGGTEY